MQMRKSYMPTNKRTLVRYHTDAGNRLAKAGYEGFAAVEFEMAEFYQGQLKAAEKARLARTEEAE
jgi:hypothetical protein